jgi:hypothetical protein
VAKKLNSGPFRLALKALPPSGAGDLRAGKSGPNKFPINRVEDDGHDRTSLFDRGRFERISVSGWLRETRKMVSPEAFPEELVLASHAANPPPAVGVSCGHPADTI